MEGAHGGAVKEADRGPTRVLLRKPCDAIEEAGGEGFGGAELQGGTPGSPRCRQ
jgi:hypothetical protein